MTLPLIALLLLLSACPANWDDASGPAPMHDLVTDHPMFLHAPTRDAGAE